MFINSKFFNCNWRYVFLVLALFSVIVSGGCGGSSGGGGGSSSGGSSSVNWVSMSGTWEPVSGDFIFYDNSGNAVVTYVLAPYSSTNFEVTISGSGNSYNLKCSSGSFYFTHESGTGSGAGGIGADQLSNFSDTFTVSGKKLVKNYSYGSAHATASFEYVDDNHVIFVVDETGYETELDEGAVRSVQTVYVERVGSSNENDNENANNNAQSNEWTSLSGTWKPMSGNCIPSDSDRIFNLDSERVENFVVTITGSGNSYNVNCPSGKLSFSYVSNTNSEEASLGQGFSFDVAEYNFNESFTVSGNELVKENYNGARISIESSDNDHATLIIDSGTLITVQLERVE